MTAALFYLTAASVFMGVAALIEYVVDLYVW